MQILKIEHGKAYVLLRPNNCQTLAQVCALAAASISTPEADHIEDLGAAFHALAIGSYAQWELTPRAHATLIHDLRTLGLNT